MVTANSAGSVAMMGGAFDPVHVGHLRTALELQTAFGLAEVRLVPSANPPHRAPHVGAADLRLRMLEAAVADLDNVTIDAQELQREGPSYTVLTLQSLRSQLGSRSLSMIVGMDAFLGLPRWHRWSELMTLAHIIVAHRPGWQPPQAGELADFVMRHRAPSPAALHEQPAGLLFMHAVTQLDISSSAIRAQLARGVSPRYLLPDAAMPLAQQAACYVRPQPAPIQEKPINAE
ncbi:MAG: nicotinate-nucleotide adenylyltransferase [Gammaproteobacteria bacterium]|jgi:nicotinate-nucleotide adenylyltransferase|nr:nicotinate-nucleotide adenylyltransferase [Gammaproteobacteria bacterium]